MLNPTCLLGKVLGYCKAMWYDSWIWVGLSSKPSKTISARASLMSGDLFNRVWFWILIEMDSTAECNFTSQRCSPTDVSLFVYSNLFQILHLKSQTFHLALNFSLAESFKCVAQNPADEFSWENVLKDRDMLWNVMGWHCWLFLILL